MKIRYLMSFVVMLFLLTACSEVSPQKQQEVSPEKPESIQQGQIDNRPSLGKVYLGDSFSQVEKLWGKDYQETYVEEAGHFSESWYKRKYPKGITIIVGKNSGKVLEVDTIAAEFQTNLGAKVGDTAQTVSELYGTKYKVYESPHGEGKVEGFYELEAGQLIVFDYNKSDDSLLNKDVKPDSKVEKIRLTYLTQMD